MTTPPTPEPAPHHGPMLPALSDEAAVEIYLFVEELFLLVDARYGDQIRRHFQEIRRNDLWGPEFDSPLDDEPF